MSAFMNRACWLLAAAMASSANAVAARYPITVEQVVEATNRAGLQISATQIELPGSLVASSPVPVLRVQSVRRLTAGSTVIRLECEAGECIPFYARLGPQKTGGASQLATAALPARSESRLAVNKRVSVIKAGDQATLWLEGEHVHINVKVVCIDGGGVGERVRARGSSNRQIYMAQVVDSGVLRARL